MAYLPFVHALNAAKTSSGRVGRWLKAVRKRYICLNRLWYARETGSGLP